MRFNQERMRDEDAVYGGEMSASSLFRDFSPTGDRGHDSVAAGGGAALREGQGDV